MVFACAVVTRHTQRNSRKLCAAFFILVIIINISKQDDHMVVMRSRNSCRTLGAPRDGRYPIDGRPRSCEAAERYRTRIIIERDDKCKKQSHILFKMELSVPADTAEDADEVQKRASEKVESERGKRKFEFDELAARAFKKYDPCCCSKLYETTTNSELCVVQENWKYLEFRRPISECSETIPILRQDLSKARSLEISLLHMSPFFPLVEIS